MKAYIPIAAALILGGCATQQPPAATAGSASVVRAGDADMTCVQIADEAAALSQRMGGTPDGGVLGAASGVAKAGASMLIPGAGLVIAGADAINAPERERREAEAAALRGRWHYLSGLYTAKHCLQDS